MIQLPKSLNAWGAPGFKEVLKLEIEQLDKHRLPLQQGLARSSHVTDSPIQALILGVTEEADRISIKAGIFYTGVIAGCNCSDDPSPIDEQNEYCVIQFVIDKLTATATTTLLQE